MTVPRTVADVLDRHVTFELESIDRMYLNIYQPLLQYPRGAAGFFHFHRGHQPIFNWWLQHRWFEGRVAVR